MWIKMKPKPECT